MIISHSCCGLRVLGLLSWFLMRVSHEVLIKTLAEATVTWKHSWQIRCRRGDLLSVWPTQMTGNQGWFSGDSCRPRAGFSARLLKHPHDVATGTLRTESFKNRGRSSHAIDAIFFSTATSTGIEQLSAWEGSHTRESAIPWSHLGASHPRDLVTLIVVAE